VAARRCRNPDCAQMFSPRSRTQMYCSQRCSHAPESPWTVAMTARKRQKPARLRSRRIARAQRGCTSQVRCPACAGFVTRHAKGPRRSGSQRWECCDCGARWTMGGYTREEQRARRAAAIRQSMATGRIVLRHGAHGKFTSPATEARRDAEFVALWSQVVTATAAPDAGGD
jgi:transposase-like protein